MKYLLYCYDKSVNFFLCIIKGKRGADTHLVAQGTECRLSAMVACTNGYAFLVEQLTHLGSRYAFKLKRHHADATLRVANERQTIYSAKLCAGILSEFVFMPLNVVNAYTANIVEGSAKANGIGHIGRSGLETGWRSIKLRLLDGNVFYHVATTLPRGQNVKHCLAAIYHANACRGIYLMS